MNGNGWRRRIGRGAAAGALLLCAACGHGTTRVHQPVERIEPALKVLEVPYVIKPKEAPEGDPLWYRELLVELETVPKEKPALQMAIEVRRGAAYRSAQQLLEEVRDQVQLALDERAGAVLLSLEFGDLEAVRNGPLILKAELGLRELYIRRDEIAVERMYLEPALTRLALQGGLRHSQRKTYNPVVSFRRQKVSVLEAIDEILKEHGFQRKLSGVGARVTTDARKFPTRELFIQTSVQSILDAVEKMRHDLPTLIVYQGKRLGEAVEDVSVDASKSEAAQEPEAKTGAEPEAKGGAEPAKEAEAKTPAEAPTGE
ncbi:MAG: hypothetical protein AMXMBFR7_39020 [Planctomycetota bacterium]